MSDPRHALGMAAEEAVAAWLSGAGWRVIGSRVRSAGGGEVDLVAVDPMRVLVAIEVRARRTSRSGAAELSVDHHRIARLGRTLATIAANRGERHRGLRIDLVTATPRVGTPGAWTLRRLPGVG